ncbi:MAG: hypothetical protein LBC68_00740 [Prevotellaceae bacterium]|nr:hypothetical protein [Prevotellaceae bacterium]
MKTRMNRLVLLFAFSFLFTNAFSQSGAKNAIRIGTGIMICNDVTGDRYRTGPAIEAEYQYSTSKYIGFTAGAGMMNIHYGKDNDYYETFATFGAIVTPVPDKFRWIKFGVGFSMKYYTDSYGYWQEYYLSDGYTNMYKIHYRYSRSIGGLDFVGRLYFIDSPKYELFASYRLKTSFDHGFSRDNALLCLCFGVKF